MRVIVSLFLLIGSISVFGSGYNGDPYEFEQPDGKMVTVLLYGTGHYIRAESIDGYTVIRDPETDWICYAKLSADQSELISTGIHYLGEEFSSAGRRSLGQLSKKHIDIAPKYIEQKIQESIERLEDYDHYDYDQGASAQRTLDNSLVNVLEGNIKGITIAVDFSDAPRNHDISEIEAMLNGDNYSSFGNNGSVKEYFKDISRGILIYENYVFGWYRAPKTFAEYDKMTYPFGPRELLTEALEWVESQGFDFKKLSRSDSTIRAINLVYTGNPRTWARGMWYHQSWHGIFTAKDGTKSGTYNTSPSKNRLYIGTIIHENGHMICNWPDLYKYNGSEDGIGAFDVMAAGRNQFNPFPPNPYFRYEKGWATAIEITPDMDTAFTSVANDDIVYKYTNPDNPREFYIFENRAQKGRSANISDEGMTIWHIDTDGDNQGRHHEVYLEHAINDNSKHWRSAFHGNITDEFSDMSLPSSTWYTGKESGLRIYDFSEEKEVMTFKVGQGGNKLIKNGPWQVIEDGYPESDKFIGMAFDRNPNSSFTTSSGSSHSITIDLKGNYSLSEFLYLPEQTGSAGIVDGYELYLTLDSSNWKDEPNFEGNWSELNPSGGTEASKFLRRIELNDTARFIRFVSKSRFLNSETTKIAELSLKGSLLPNSPPVPASGPLPRDFEFGVNDSILLTWEEGAGATSYYVYFGDTSALETKHLIDTTNNDLSTLVTGLQRAKDYYWRVDVENEFGFVKGKTWTFKTFSRGIYEENADIGDVPTAGVTDFRPLTKEYIVRGSGNNIWNIADQFHYLFSRTQLANVEMIVKLSEVQNTTEYAKGGIMFRNSTDASSSFGAVVQLPDNTVNFFYRESFRGTAKKNIEYVGGTENPKYVKLLKSEGKVSAYYSNESAKGPWTQIGTAVTVDLSNEHLVGLFALSNNATLCEVVFGEASIKEYIRPIKILNPIPKPNDNLAFIDQKLSWTSESTVTNNKVYFSDDYPPELVSEQTETNYDPGPLQNGITYFWRVDQVTADSTFEGQIMNFTVADLPGMATNPKPDTMSVGVFEKTSLTWNRGIGSTSSIVHLGEDRNNLSIVDTVFGGTYTPAPLQNSTEYFWKIDAVNNGGLTHGDIWSFNTRSEPEPKYIFDPSPVDNETDISISKMLTWNSDSTVSGHVLYFGNHQDSLTLVATLAQGKYQLSDLLNDKQYFWRVDQKTDLDVFPGKTYGFTTAIRPEESFNPNPDDNGENVPLLPNLQWEIGQGTSMNILYFGVSDTSLQVMDTLNANSYTISDSLSTDTIYFWRVDGVGNGGYVKGNIWTFKTTATPQSITNVHKRDVFVVEIFPNPSSDRFGVSFDLKTPQRVEVVAYDLLGQKVSDVNTGDYREGKSTIYWEHAKENVNVGTYFLKIKVGDYSQVYRLVIEQ